VATDENGDGVANVYDPPDAIAGAAKYLLEFGVQSNPSGAIFAYNHLQSYVQSVLMYAGQYAGGNFSVASAQLPAANTAAGCVQAAGGVPAVQAPTQAVAAVISFAEQQLGKPYLWGGTGPDAFDCSGLMMMAYRAAGISIARTSQAQWASETRVPASQVQPGDLVFFAGSDGTVTDPGHVGLVIGGGKMIEAYATGFPIRVSSYANRGAVGFTEPWAGQGHHPGQHGAPGQHGHPGQPGRPGRPEGRHPHPRQRRLLPAHYPLATASSRRTPRHETRNSGRSDAVEPGIHSVPPRAPQGPKSRAPPTGPLTVWPGR
jgi:cell wall-associated NlpC family hydrolase